MAEESLLNSFSLGQRLAGAILFGLIAWPLVAELERSLTLGNNSQFRIVILLSSALIGLITTPYLTKLVAKIITSSSQSVPSSKILASTIGLISGLVVAILISVPLSRLTDWPGVWLPIILTLLFAIIGAAIAVNREEDLLSLFPQLQSLSSTGGKMVLDTSAIIDGRIADISHTGFVPGEFIIPTFILDELRHIADSSDSVRRNRGRRGLEMLNKLRKDSSTAVQVVDVDRWEGQEVDTRLVLLAKSLRVPIVTTDFNLNRVAEIQDVHVLNVNELANALKSVVLPGEEMELSVIQEGKESGQGIGFLDDGTMVVVEGGRRFLDRTVYVSVTRVLQTAAGRLVFAHPIAG